jgi:hypothetical protein
MANVAVVGGGIFGSTAAIFAARAGHTVTLYEEKSDVLQAASAINQYRLHRGYHYPRSSETARSAIEAEKSFGVEYADAVIDGGRHLYAIAKENSLVSGKEFLAFCDAHGLSYNMVSIPEIVTPEMIEFVIEGVEARFDPDLLRTAVKKKLADAGVTVLLNTHAGVDIESKYDQIILAAYAGLNAAVSEFTGELAEYQYEICEKPVVKLPEAFGQTDLVIMDGPFMCVDPLGTSGLYVLGNVVHAIHATNIGAKPDVPELIKPMLNAGIIKNPSVTNFDAFIASGTPYIPMLKDAVHVGSMFTVRTVLPRIEKTDARPTLVTMVDDKYIKIFSGKIGNCVLAAQEAVSLI